MINVESKLQLAATESADADPLNPVWMPYLASVTMTAVATVLAIAVDSRVSIPNPLVFVVPVIVAGLSFGLGPSICSAISGALAFNFFLTEPRHSLAIDDPSNIWAMALLFAVGLIVSGVAATSHRRASEVSDLRKQATLLQDFSRDVAKARDAEAIALLASQTLAALFQVPAVAMLLTEGKVNSIKPTGDARLDEAELEAARSSLASGSLVRGGVYPYLDSRYDFWPVLTDGGQDGAIGLAFDPNDRPPTPDVHVMVVARLMALTLDRERVEDARVSRF